MHSFVLASVYKHYFYTSNLYFNSLTIIDLQLLLHQNDSWMKHKQFIHVLSQVSTFITLVWRTILKITYFCRDRIFV